MQSQWRVEHILHSKGAAALQAALTELFDQLQVVERVSY